MSDNRELVDIRTVAVEKSLPPMERIAEYVRQLGDPYHFICGPYTFTAIYPENGQSMEDCLRGAVS